MAGIEKPLFLVSRVLGGKTFCAHLQRVASRLQGMTPSFLYFEEEDYGLHRDKAPWLSRFTGKLTASHIARWKLDLLRDADFDALFIQSFELLPALVPWLKRYPSIVAHDSTNILSYNLIVKQVPGIWGSIAARTKAAVMSPFYRPAVKHVQVFMPRTSWCASSLSKDYGVDPGRVVVSPGGMDTQRWKPIAKTREGKSRLLFVGNDFVRKGGPLLLETFRRYLSAHARLRIVSNDPVLTGMNWPEGVEHSPGLGRNDPDAVLRAYQDSDLFVFPTRKDHMGMVLTEAAATGLPIVATDVGGVSEVVRHGSNGFLMPYDANAEEWGNRILQLLKDEEMMRRFSEVSRRLAEENFSEEVFLTRLRLAFSMVQPTAHSRAVASEPLKRPNSGLRLAGG